ncbi:diguanylate cyclase [Oscillospiraceae bacterium OttesenSCG-928-F05]|nr:diguanylate cyclase [Oscillospiraceae bacterium OttesenSCG-928-F05]
MENTQVPHDAPLSVTASIGVAIVSDGDTVKSIVERADKLMYQSKQSGKNRVSSD